MASNPANRNEVWVYVGNEWFIGRREGEQGSCKTVASQGYFKVTSLYEVAGSIREMPN